MRIIGKLTVMLLLLATTACQANNGGDTPAAASREEPASQGEVTEEPEPDEPATVNSGPVALSEQLMEQHLRAAQVLTEHLMNRVLHEGIVEYGEDIADRELFYFFTTLPAYMQNKNHPYSDAVAFTPEYLYIFPEEMVRRVAYELFGLEGWSFEGDIMEYHADTGQYESSLEFGTGANQYRSSELRAVYLEDDGVVEVAFELEGVTAVDGDPGWEYWGRYMIRYQVVQENGVFLRYRNIQKAG